MAEIINTNVMSLNSQRHLANTKMSMATSIQRLSSGLRVNSAKDDAAGLAIAEGMTSKIRGLDVAMRNANDGISMAQTAESALGQVTNNMQRIRELAVQSANGTLQDSERELLQKEVDELTAEITRIIDTTEFNGATVFDNTNAVAIQIGPNKGETIDITNVDLAADLAGVGYGAAAKSVDISTSAAASAVIASGSAGGGIDEGLFNVNAARATMGAVQNRFDSVIANLSSYSENLSAARSRIMDTDYAKETAELTRTQILQQAGTAMVAQANSIPQGVLSLLG